MHIRTYYKTKEKKNPLLFLAESWVQGEKMERIIQNYMILCEGEEKEL